MVTQQAQTAATQRDKSQVPEYATEMADFHSAFEDELRNLVARLPRDTLARQLDPATLNDDRLPARLLPRPAQASDHCPLQTRLQWR